MRSFKQFMSESVNISGDFNGNLYVNSQPEEPKQVGENYVADVTWMGSIYRLEMVSKNGIPTKQELGEQLQKDYPGAMVQNIYPGEAPSKIRSSKRYQPERLTWSD